MIRLIILAILPFYIFSCDTRRELFEDNSIPVKININWKDANINPNGTSIWVFSEDNPESTPRQYLTHDSTYTVHLKKGSYSILVFNESINDFDYILFRGTSSYETFEAYAIPIETKGRFAKSQEEQVAARPDILAVDRIELFTITRDIINLGKGITLDFSPKRLVVSVQMTIHIKNLSSMADNGNAASLSGLAGGVMLSTGNKTINPVTHYFQLSNKILDPGSDNNGTISSCFNSFGLMGSLRENKVKSHYEQFITLYLKLRDNSIYPPVVINVTDDIEYVGNAQHCISIVLGTEGSESVQLPYVIGDNDNDSGFEVDVSDWGEEVIIDVPL